MNKLKFEWDIKKDKSNAKKHGVTFEEAQTVFYDEYAIQFFDPEHFEDEDRFILLDTSFKSKILVICHCFERKKQGCGLSLQEKQIKMKNRHIGVKENEISL